MLFDRKKRERGKNNRAHRKRRPKEERGRRRKGRNQVVGPAADTAIKDSSEEVESEKSSVSHANIDEKEDTEADGDKESVNERKGVFGLLKERKRHERRPRKPHDRARRRKKEADEKPQNDSSADDGNKNVESKADTEGHNERRGRLRKLLKSRKESKKKRGKKLNVPLEVRARALQALAQNFMSGGGFSAQSLLPVLGMLAFNSQPVQNMIGEKMGGLLTNPSMQQAVGNMLRSMFGGMQNTPDGGTPGPYGPADSRREELISKLRAFAEGTDSVSSAPAPSGEGAPPSLSSLLAAPLLSRPGAMPPPPVRESMNRNEPAGELRTFVASPETTGGDTLASPPPGFGGMSNTDELIARLKAFAANPSQNNPNEITIDCKSED